ncbi:helix-turn-helix transcriptional regulator [candidate division NPL-UPA2 bacterium]|nr:helix-turn-helix transcriptional regulator [candidate division NPL-UPA2 bacterium]
MRFKSPKRLNEICEGKNDLGLEIVKRLYIMGKNQIWLAKECGVSKQYINQIINGKSRPSPKVTEKLAELFAMDVKLIRELVLQVS